MTPSTQALQRDDTANPGMLWLKQGEAQWNDASHANNKSCASCHTQASNMRGVSRNYPKFDTKQNKPLTLSQRINACRVNHQQEVAWPVNHNLLLGLEVLIANQSRRQKIAREDTSDPRLAPYVAQGKSLFEKPLGQLNMACTQCHDQYAGKKLGSAIIPEGHPNAYPLYRLEWQSLGSLQRRLRNCMTGVRAAPFAYDSIEFTAIELYLNQRAVGLEVETPGVRP